MGKMHTKILSCGVSFALAAALVPALPMAAFAEGEQNAAGGSSFGGAVPADADGLIVVLDDRKAQGKSALASRNAARALSSIETMGASVEETVVSADADSGTVLKVAVPEGEDAAAYADALAEKPGIAYVQPNFRYRLLDADWQPDGDDAAENATAAENAQADGADAQGTASPLMKNVSDPRVNEQYYLYGKEGKPGSHGANVLNAWDDVTSDYGVTVAVLDTGIIANHEDLKENIDTDNMWDAYNNTEPGTIVSSANPYGDVVGHGTHVAGIVSAKADNKTGIAGVSYNARILPIKVFNDETGIEAGSYTSDLIKAYNYLFERVDAGKVNNLRVINMSLGSYQEEEDDALFERYINTARDEYGIVTVVAGGNGDDNNNALTTKSYPSDFDACVSVTALEANGRNAKWSDYNQYKDISAPGVGILSTYYTSDSAYESLSGTSMASPVVAGVFALLFANNQYLSVDEAIDCVYNTAAPVVDPVYDRTTPDANGVKSGSHGAIDADAAIAYENSHFEAKPKTPLASGFAQAIDRQMWTGKAIEPAVSLTDTASGTALEEGVDYKVSYKNNVNVGTGYAVVTGWAAYSGRIEIPFDIRYDIAQATIEGISETYDYLGASVAPEPQVYFRGRQLIEGANYTVAYEGNDAPGTARVVVSGVGSEFSGVNEQTFKLVARDMKNATIVGLSARYPHTGSAIEPAVSVLYGNELLVPGKDYKVAYSDNVEVGSAKVVVSGIAPYVGEKEATFAIVDASDPGAGGTGSGGTGSGDAGSGGAVSPADPYAADKARAKVFDDAVTAIGQVTLESEQAISQARAVYDALTPVQKAFCARYDDLLAAEKKLADLKADAADPTHGGNEIPVFSDVGLGAGEARHWVVSSGYLQKAVSMGLMKGYAGTDSFGPDDALTRGQLALILFRHADPAAADAIEKNATPFADNESGQYYTAAVNWAYAQGIMAGADGLVRPRDPISREEMAAMFYRYAVGVGADASGAGASSYAGKPDAAGVSTWAQAAMGWCVSHGVISGDAATGELLPAKAATRAETCKMAVELVGLIPEAK